MKRANSIAVLAAEHGWSVYREDDGEVVELHAQRYVGDHELVWTIVFVRPRGRCLKRALALVSADGNCMAARYFRALTHVEHWLARPDEVVAWSWVRQTAASSPSSSTGGADA